MRWDGAAGRQRAEMAGYGSSRGAGYGSERLVGVGSGMSRRGMSGWAWGEMSSRMGAERFKQSVACGDGKVAPGGVGGVPPWQVGAGGGVGQAGVGSRERFGQSVTGAV